ncbi:uncharacterized protein LOC133714287 [Rosa rugosa]|uniref:uncharacterized protein LOC133714287 n=1 Tax=Rosa rugosa TaxID=74645 RepID=UPI002B407FAB|nr:uncharacterized protein LOC133714287 [Rosa rugosa]
MNVETRMEIVDQDLKHLRTSQSQDRLGDVSLHIKNLEKELILLSSIKKIDHELERLKELDRLYAAGGNCPAIKNLERARHQLVREQMSLAIKTRCSSLLCSSKNIEDELKKLKALEPTSDNCFSNMRSAIQLLETAKKDVKFELAETEALETMGNWCMSKLDSFLDRLRPNQS